jgi:hypothetical protein
LVVVEIFLLVGVLRLGGPRILAPPSVRVLGTDPEGLINRSFCWYDLLEPVGLQKLSRSLEVAGASRLFRDTFRTTFGGL